MLLKLDKMIMDLAKITIRVAAFFGISRIALIIVYVVVSSVFFASTYDVSFFEFQPEKNIYMPTIFVFFALLRILVFPDEEDQIKFREDPHRRLFWLIVFSVFSIVFSLKGKEILPVVLLLKIFLPYYFYAYLLANGSSKDPLTLRNLVKGWMRMPKITLTPTSLP